MKKLLGLTMTLALAAMCTTGVFAGGLIAENPAAAKTQPVAEVEGGKLIGFTRGDTYCFWGVDYAYAERFEQPQKVEPWEGYQFAQSYGTISLIEDQTAVGADEFVWPHRYWTQSDHCQNLNIWTQSMDPAAKKPVIVFFHGGGYANGSSIESTAYDGQRLSEYGDVVVVTVNHRLNYIGFLDLSSFGGKYEGSGNAGMADLAAALQWIHDNIEQFGGDPENVLIFGQSGGGGKVASLLRMPSASGLFHRAGMISGGGTTISDNEFAKKVGERTVELAGLTADTVDELQTMSYRELVPIAKEAIAQVCEEEGVASYRPGPTADGVVIMPDFVNVEGLPMIISGCYSESAVSSYRFGDFRHHEWDEAETMEKLTERFGDKAEALLAEWQKLYPEMEDREMYFYNNTMNNKFPIAETFTELGATTYLYEFDYENPINGGITAFHCEDLLFLFHNVDEPMVAISYGDPDAKIVEETMCNAFLQFSATGDPGWAAYEPGSHNVMKFNVESQCVDLDTTAYTEILNAE